MSGFTAQRAAAALPDSQSQPGDGDPLSFVSVTVAGQLIGIPILRIRDVFVFTAATPVPLASPEIAGLINLRGRVIPIICARTLLGLPDSGGGAELMVVTLESGQELLGLMVDEVGDVIELPASGRGKIPANLDPRWARIGAAIWHLPAGLMIELDAGSLMRQTPLAA